MQKRQGKAEANTKGGEEEAKGGETVQEIKREDVVQAALTVERWCAEHHSENGCDCPFYSNLPFLDSCRLSCNIPADRKLEDYLRNRGLKDD